jgi:O-antigen biosynthesis protein
MSVLSYRVLKNKLHGDYQEFLDPVSKALLDSGVKGMRARYKQAYQTVKQHYYECETVDENPVITDLGFMQKCDQKASDLFIEQQSELNSKATNSLLATFSREPLISIIVPVYNTPDLWLRKCIDSVLNQEYNNWELCLVDDASPNNSAREIIKEYAEIDPRVRFHFSEENGGIAKSSNIALDMAKGEYIALLDHDDELTKDALFWVVNELNEYPTADFIYTDECKVSDDEEETYFHFQTKVHWSPELLLNYMYTGHLTVYPIAKVRSVGGFRSEFDFSQDYDLALRMSEEAECIRHIPRFLYLWRAIEGSAANGGKDFARVSNLSALRSAMERRGVDANIIAKPRCNYAVTTRVSEEKVSIIIPSDSYDASIKCIDSLLVNTAYTNYEIVLVCNSKVADLVERDFSYAAVVRCCRYDQVYNFSDKCNAGARYATGEIVLFYNDDVFPIDSSWLGNVVLWLNYPGVGGVSPKLLYEDRTIQYFGMMAGTPGLVGTCFNNFPYGDHALSPCDPYSVRNVSVLSGACCALRRDVFMKIGQFDAINTPSAHSDTDLSFKLLEHGYRCVCTPHAELIHIGNHTWHSPQGVKDKSDVWMLQRWGGYLSEDKYVGDANKKVHYHDFEYNYKIHPVASEAGSYDALLFVHELSHTGAPRLLLSLALAIKNHGGYPVVVSPVDGPLRGEFTKNGISVIIDESVNEPNFLFERFVKNFDVVVVNSIVLYHLVVALEFMKDRLMWWIHEGSYVNDMLKQGSEADLVQLKEAFTVADKVYACVPDYCRGEYKDFSDKVDFATLDYPVLDDYNRLSHLSSSNNDIITVLVAGTVEKRKGQDVLLEAACKLSKDLLKLVHFQFVGNYHSEPDFAAKFRMDCAALPSVEHLDALPQDQILEMYAKADLIIVPSREDRGPLTCIQALMMGKPVVVSSASGVASYLTNSENAFVFPNENVEALREQLVYILENFGHAQEIGKSGRTVYEDLFTQKKFDDRVRQILEEDLKLGALAHQCCSEVKLSSY